VLAPALYLILDAGLPWACGTHKVGNTPERPINGDIKAKSLVKWHFVAGEGGPKLAPVALKGRGQWFKST
jgi:hypothetical protein